MTGEHTKTAIDVVISNDQDAEVDEDRIKAMAATTAESEGAVGEISITLVGEDRMTELNRVYLGGRGPTDVLSFPVDGLSRKGAVGAEEPPVIIGEVVLCPAVAARSDAALGEELDLLTAHGVLHLLGHDHHDEQGAARMRAAEKRLTGRAGARSATQDPP